MRYALIFIACALTGCASAPQSDEWLVRASELTKLTAAVEGYVRYDAPDGTAAGRELLEAATKHDPALLAPFADLSVRVRTQNRHASVLVCTRDERRGMLEDVGCTGKLDRALWQMGTRPCSFTLDIAAVCGPD